MPPKRPAPVRRSPLEAPTKEEAHKINNRIDSRDVRLIDADGNNVGVVPTRQAMIMADEAGLDLVEISPDANPPVAKILDYGKFKFQEQKRLAEARKKQRVVEIKEIKLRPMIDDHDFETKLKAAKRFFEEGDKEEAVEVLAMGIKHHPDNAELFYRMAACLLWVGKKQEALTYLQSALQLDYKKHKEIFKFLPELRKNRTVLDMIKSYRKR
jgi:translation initiation factor IF-3